MLRAKMVETTSRLRGREELRHFVRMVRIRLRGQMDSMNPQFWMNAANLAKRIYGLSRRTHGEELLKCCARVAAEWGQTLLTPEEVVIVVKESFVARGRILKERELEVIRSAIRDRAAVVAEARKQEGSMGTEVRSEKSECKSRSAEPKPEGAEDRKRVSLSVADLRNRVQKYLSGRVEGVDPYEVSGDLVDSVVAGGNGNGNKGNGKGNKGNGKGKQRERRKQPGRGSAVARATATTPLDRYGLKRAERAVSLAVAGKHSIVKRCVAERLFNHLSFDELAELLDISRSDVATTLERMRGWVRKYTTYFNNDWYWDDDAPKFRLPDVCPGRGGQTT